MNEFMVVDKHFLPHQSCEVRIAIGQGETLALTGPNGIGKSTLLNRLFQDTNVSVSYIEQAPLDFFYERRLIDLKEVFLNVRGTEVDLSVFEGLWSKFGLVEKETRPLSTLSGGERQSLKLVLGLAKRANVYLLDEAFQSLDQNRRDLLCVTLELMKAKGSSFIVVEHDLTLLGLGWRVIPLINVEGTMRTGVEWSI